jgi:hypothetical protein
MFSARFTHASLRRLDWFCGRLLPSRAFLSINDAGAYFFLRRRGCTIIAANSTWLRGTKMFYASSR